MTRKDIFQLYKRFFITFFCCSPVFIILGYLLKDKIKNWILGFVFVVLGGLIFALEEWIHFKSKQKRLQLKQQLKSKQRGDK